MIWFSRRNWLVGLGLAGLIALFLWRLVGGNLILAQGDAFLYFYPYWEAASQALRSGRVPLWNPQLFMGAPFLANSQVGFFYPLNWPVWWLLPVPYTFTASIVLHLGLGGLGVYWLGRRRLGLSRPGAFLSASLFALSGYLMAQVAHINQLQGLAWLPWVLGVYDLGLAGGSGGWWRWLRATLPTHLLLAGLLALQLAAGHTQTLFITLVGLGLWLVVGTAGRWRTDLLRYGAGLGLAGLLAGGLVAIQLLPTLELIQRSGRAGGLPLNEALSFSLHPLLLTRSLLPDYGPPLFSEYVAFLPLTACLLAGLAVWRCRSRPELFPVLVLTVVGLFFALGQFNPLYVLLARLPGFAFFRVPARWLVLYSFGMALLAGAGWDSLADLPNRRRPLVIGLFFLLALIGWGAFSPGLARFIPTGPEAPAGLPTPLTWLGWLLELVVAGWGLSRPGRAAWLYPLCLLVLFAASRQLPINQPTTPEAYFDLRPPVARLQAISDTGRVLSLSQIFFDLGDQAEIDTIYADQLPVSARYDYTIASKQKEVLAPNLPMAYGLASVDGHDGGILPLRDYMTLTSLILPNGQQTSDGRLREFLRAVPEARWLDLFRATYLITDKTGDVWRETGRDYTAYLDLQHPVTIPAGQSLSVPYLPPFPATGLLLHSVGPAGTIRLNGQAALPQPLADDLSLADWGQPVQPTSLELTAGDQAWQLLGLTLLNDQSKTFSPLVAGQYRLIYSGDVKIYENLDVLPPAFVVFNWQWQPDVAASVAAMAPAGFDPHTQAIVVGQGSDQTGQRPAASRISLAHYAPEQVILHTTSDRDGLLVLNDAFYPGWQATVDARPVPIYQVDGLFRGVMLPAGMHTVHFTFEPQSYVTGRVVSLIACGLWLVLAAIAKRQKPDRSPKT